LTGSAKVFRMEYIEKSLFVQPEQTSFFIIGTLGDGYSVPGDGGNSVLDRKTAAVIYYA